MKILSMILIGWLVFATDNTHEYKIWIDKNCRPLTAQSYFTNSSFGSRFYFIAVCWQ